MIHFKTSPSSLTAPGRGEGRDRARAAARAAFENLWIPSGRGRGEMRDPMRRIEALAKQVHDHARELADGEIELTGDDVGTVARLTEEAFIAAMRAAFRLDDAPAAGRGEGP